MTSTWGKFYLHVLVKNKMCDLDVNIDIDLGIKDKLKQSKGI